MNGWPLAGRLAANTFAGWSGLLRKLRQCHFIQKRIETELAVHVTPSRKCSRNLPGPSWIAGFWEVGFYLPVSLPGTFPDLAGLRFFIKHGFCTVSTFPFPFPEPSWIAFFLKNVFLGTVSGVKVDKIISKLPSLF